MKKNDMFLALGLLFLFVGCSQGTITGVAEREKTASSGYSSASVDFAGTGTGAPVLKYRAIRSMFGLVGYRMASTRRIPEIQESDFKEIRINLYIIAGLKTGDMRVEPSENGHRISGNFSAISH